MVAFLDQKMGNAPEGGGTDVDIGLGLDLSGTADNGGQILLDELSGQDLGVAGLLAVDEETDEAGSHHDCNDDQEDLFHGRYVLQVCLESVYANDLVMVPKERENLAECAEKGPGRWKAREFSATCEIAK